MQKITKPLVVGAFCELSVYSGKGREIYDCHIVEIVGAAVMRVQLVGGGILRVMASQLRAI
jgi:hypothetical protein